MENRKLATGPVTGAERIASLDVLRGFAVLGILTMNIWAFSMPPAAYFNPTVWGDLTGANRLVYQLTHVLADLKFLAIFSMLFGAGIVLMTERRAAAGRPATGLHYRRMFWLLVFGLAHAHIVWYGDVLALYAVCGSLVYLARNLKPRTLLVLGVLVLAPGSLFSLAAGLTLPQWPADAVANLVAELDPSAEALQRQIDAYRGGFLEQTRVRSAYALQLETGSFLAFFLWRVSGLMLLGMALFKLGVFSASRSNRFYLGLIAAGVLIGVPVVAYGMSVNFARDWQMPESMFLGIQYNYWGSPLVALGWVGAVMLACRTGFLASLQERLAAVGRMAFTNYIVQSLLCTFIFYGHGLGLFGSVSRVGQAGIVIAVWTLQLIYSPIWLARFRFGPLEWLWRSLAYGRRPRFKRAIAA